MQQQQHPKGNGGIAGIVAARTTAHGGVADGNNRTMVNFIIIGVYKAKEPL